MTGRANENATKEKEQRCSCHICTLSMELLLMIFSHLSALDYIYFRAVCKCWQSAFCSLIRLNNKPSKQLPCFLILSCEQPRTFYTWDVMTKPVFRTTGKFGDLSTKRIFSTDIPELCGTQILVSKYGWFLLFSSEEDSSSLFFFNLFSRAKMSIPYLDVRELEAPEFDISAPPTSSECMVFFICWSYYGYKIGLCSRREYTWKIEHYFFFDKPKAPDPVVNTVFVNGIWYCLHKNGNFSTFDTASYTWVFLDQPKGKKLAIPVSFAIKRGGQVSLRVHGSSWYEMALKNPLEIVASSESRIHTGVEYFMRTDVETTFRKLQNVLQVDSFNAGAWCGLYDSDGFMTFRWHRFYSSMKLDHWSCTRGEEQCSASVMWFEPVLPLVDSSSNLSWVLML